jgi:hypothetical protein
LVSKTSAGPDGRVEDAAAFIDTIPGLFESIDTLGTWQSFLAELETMEDFQNKDIEIRTRRTFDWRMADLSWCIPSFQ